MTSDTASAAAAEPLATVDMTISSMGGDQLFHFQVPISDTVKQIKLRIWERCGAHLFTQKLVHSSLGVLDDASAVNVLQSPVALQLIRLKLDNEKGASLLKPALQGDAARVELILSDLAHPEIATPPARHTYTASAYLQ